MKELLLIDSNYSFRYWGGENMKNVQGKPVKHIKELAFMGFIEVLLNIRTILKNISFCKKDISKFQPDALILVDYPGFNLRIAEWAKQNGIKTYYYISPQVWAWKENRVRKIKESVDQLFVILPFEKDFYRKHQMEVTFIGHPLVDAIQQFKTNKALDLRLGKLQLNASIPIIALLPGSRKQEIMRKLPVMLEATKLIDGYQFVIAGAPSLTEEFYQNFTQNFPNVKIIFDATYTLLSVAEGAFVTSGTATLETALFRVPQVVCYKGAYISYWIAKQLIKVKYISLVNLILDKMAVEEFIQQDCTPEKIANGLKRVLPSGDNHCELLNQYDLLIQLLGDGGASRTIARQIDDLLNKG
ncbi:MAG: lipid-A-disaccharide synthase [Crocinitomicaceae bacterium]|nr:lipid-A-disaccharide synthase [Crocinitomicaceae bacterium]